jgi:thymidylate synthase
MEHLAEDFSNANLNILNKENSDKKNTNLKNILVKELHEEYQYLNLIENIVENGFLEEGRNGKTKSIFGSSMRFSLKDGKIPILTTKKTAWKTCLKELLWFIRGETDNKILKEQGVHIWDANGSREFLDSRGLIDYEVDELGPIYGYQWRGFDRNYFSKAKWEEMGDKKENSVLLRYKGIDQLQQIIDALKDPKERTSRRLIMTAWNPNQLHKMALPPCHILCQFNVHNGNQLSCSMYQRSADYLLGVPFNIASYSFLTHLIAKHCNLEAQDFYYYLGNCHIYESHIDELKTQINNKKLYEFPTVEITDKLVNINDYNESMFVVKNYNFSNIIKMKMIA